MTKTNKLLERKTALENVPEVKFFIKFTKKPFAERDYMIKSYDEFIKSVQDSEPFKLAEMGRKLLKIGDRVRLAKVCILARKKLAEGDFVKAPYDFDPGSIAGSFFVSQYRKVLSDLESENRLANDVADNLF